MDTEFKLSEPAGTFCCHRNRHRKGPCLRPYTNSSDWPSPRCQPSSHNVKVLYRLECCWHLWPGRINVPKQVSFESSKITSKSSTPQKMWWQLWTKSSTWLISLPGFERFVLQVPESCLRTLLRSHQKQLIIQKRFYWISRILVQTRAQSIPKLR